MPPELKQIVSGHTAKFILYREGNFIYEANGFQFPIPIADVPGVTLYAEERALSLMKWIRRHLDTVTKETIKNERV